MANFKSSIVTCLLTALIGAAHAQSVPLSVADMAAYQGPDRQAKLIEAAKKESGLAVYHTYPALTNILNEFGNHRRRLTDHSAIAKRAHARDEIRLLADGADRREIPLQVIGKFRLGDHFVAVEVAADVIPLAAPVDDLSARMEFQRAAYARGVAHLVDQRGPIATTATSGCP